MDYVFRTDTVSMRERFKALEKYRVFLKRELEEYITNPAHSLELRWKMFVDAPKSLSNHGDFVYHGFDSILDPTGGDVNLIDRIGMYDRYQTVDVVDTVNEVFSKPSEYNIDHYPGTKEEGFLDRIKEQVLKDNIKSYEYDW